MTQQHHRRTRIVATLGPATDPPEVLEAVLRAGVDVVRLFGALAANIRQGGYAQGASTITMQLIRQSHLSTQKTIARKLEATK